MIARGKPQQLFDPGRFVGTPGALRALRDSCENGFAFLARHMTGDWGECDEADTIANQIALFDGSRIFSVYRTRSGVKLWVITEARDDAGRRQSTCILLPDEY